MTWIIGLGLIAMFGWMGLVLIDQFWGHKIRARADAARQRLYTIQNSAPIKYPVILKANSVQPCGSTRRSMVEMYPDHLLVRHGGIRPSTARINVDQILCVTFKDQSRDGYPMAGFELETLAGDYVFHSVGLFAPSRMKKATRTIQTIYHARMGHEMPVTTVG